MILSTSSFIVCMLSGTFGGALVGWLLPKIWKHDDLPDSNFFTIDVAPCCFCDSEEPLLYRHPEFVRI